MDSDVRSDSAVANGQDGRRSRHAIDGHLIAGLVRMLDWIDNSLQNVLADRGFEPVHRTQSLILVHIASGIENPADIAREMGSTRQNIHHMAKSLIDAGIVAKHPDPLDPRRSIYRLRDNASDIRSAALGIMHSLEKAMARRAGVSAAEMKVFRKVLASDWGPLIEDQADLDASQRSRKSRKGKNR